MRRLLQGNCMPQDKGRFSIIYACPYRIVIGSSGRIVILKDCPDCIIISKGFFSSNSSLIFLMRIWNIKLTERKKCNMILQTGTVQGDTPPDSCKSRSRRIPIPWTYFRNVEFGRDLINKSARFSHDLICKMFISPLFWRSWGKNHLGEICLVILLLMYHVCICATQAALSS